MIKGWSQRFNMIDFMLAYQREHGRPATLRQIAKAVGLSSYGSLRGYQLKYLERKGYVEQVYGGSSYVALKPYVEIIYSADARDLCVERGE